MGEASFGVIQAIAISTLLELYSLLFRQYTAATQQ